MSNQHQTCVNKHHPKTILTGAAGLVGQNLVIELTARGHDNLVAVDKHERNLATLAELHPDVRCVHADLAEPGLWEKEFQDASSVIQLQAQVTSKHPQEFVRNNIESTQRVLAAMHAHDVPYLVHISSSVVVSVADDDYTNTKKEQEQLVVASGLPYCILRPTLMFGWFDPKHLGWLGRFMAKTPVFPIPGHGRYMRQPLYELDFCRCIAACLEKKPRGAIFDVVGDTRIDYVDIIRTIKRTRKLHTLIVHLPVGVFSALLRAYALISRKPPFTADQLKALIAGDDFRGVDTQAVFDVTQTPFAEAMDATFNDPRYGGICLER